MKPRTFTLDMALDDHRGYNAGDYLFTARTAYEILDARPVDSKMWDNRWKVTARKIGTRSDIYSTLQWVDVCADGQWERRTLDGIGIRESLTYRRGETPRDFFGEPDPEGTAP